MSNTPAFTDPMYQFLQQVKIHRYESSIPTPTTPAEETFARLMGYEPSLVITDKWVKYGKE